MYALLVALRVFILPDTSSCVFPHFLQALSRKDRGTRGCFVLFRQTVGNDHWTTDVLSECTEHRKYGNPVGSDTNWFILLTTHRFGVVVF